MFYLNSTLNFGILPVLVFQSEVYYKVDKLLAGLTAQQKGTTARWYSNKTSLRIKTHDLSIPKTPSFENIMFIGKYAHEIFTRFFCISFL